MWYACSIAINSWFENSPINGPRELSCGIRLEPVPEWVKDDEALKLLSWTDREHIRDAELAFAAEYEADTLGSRDPGWTGATPRSIQATVDENFALASVAMWVAKPSRLTAGPVLHFARKGDATSLRQAGSLHPVLILEEENESAPTEEDLERAGQLLQVILSLRRDATIWTAVWMLVRALTERSWEVRYALQWVVLEALFGPESPTETTYRLAQRIGVFVGDSSGERKHLFQEAKQAYAWRSKIVHGRRLARLTPEQSLRLSAAIEGTTRRVITKVLMTPDLVRQFDSKDRDKFLDELLFQQG